MRPVPGEARATRPLPSPNEGPSPGRRPASARGRLVGSALHERAPRPPPTCRHMRQRRRPPSPPIILPPPPTCRRSFTLPRMPYVRHGASSPIHVLLQLSTATQRRERRGGLLPLHCPFEPVQRWFAPPALPTSRTSHSPTDVPSNQCRFCKMPSRNPVLPFSPSPSIANTKLRGFRVAPPSSSSRRT